MKIKTIFCLLLITFALSSCESLLHYTGNVYNDKNEPIENAKISLIIGKRDTVQKMGEIMDSVSLAQRKALRKKGIKDNFKYSMSGGLSESKILFTDKNGHFETRTLWMGCGFSNCPKVKILVEKDHIIKAFPIEELKKEVIKDSLRPHFIKEKKLSIFL
ncbi:hypothetical protein [Chryseobacterium sp. MMS23-Vi53]|uniref:hypothetical protein n=1 Tax=Chryseobacterium sp. MMS23-Vi53 TaxID=3386644 RepID=UPI0039EBF1DA